MKKILVLVSLIALFLFIGCTSEEKEITKVVKIMPANNTQTQNITLNFTGIQNQTNASANVSGNATANITANITNQTSANATANATNATAATPAVLKNLTVEILNQFEGNSILITTPQNKKIVIDGGTNKDGLYLVKYLLSKGIYKVDYIFASNSEDDNTGGLDSVILNYNETKPFYSGLQYINHNAYRNYLTYAKLIAHSLTELNRSQKVNTDSSITFSAFVPSNASSENAEDDTTVFKIKYDDSTILFMGDCTEKCFENIKGEDLKADIVKTNKELSDEMLGKISPKAIIFRQKPSNFTTNAKVYSKEDGIIRIASDGQKYYISIIKQ